MVLNSWILGGAKAGNRIGVQGLDLKQMVEASGLRGGGEGRDVGWCRAQRRGVEPAGSGPSSARRSVVSDRIDRVRSQSPDVHFAQRGELRAGQRHRDPWSVRCVS